MSSDCIEIDEADGHLLVSALEVADSLAAPEAMADLKLYSHGLVDWLLSDLKSLLELRGADNLVAGLCHPSPELRRLLISEMQQFRTPADPFQMAWQ